MKQIPRIIRCHYGLLAIASIIYGQHKVVLYDNCIDFIISRIENHAQGYH